MASADTRRLLGGGEFVPLYGTAKPNEKVTVSPFQLDTYPVTNAQFLSFTQSHTSWARSKVSRLLADEQYLKHWPLKKGNAAAPQRADMRRPVINVSWFAANDYCVSVGGRLPSVFEWEYVAAASETKPDASRDPEFVQQLLTWYANPGTKNLPEIGKSRANYWGIYDLHGLVWEWTADFNSATVVGDSRRDGEQSNNLFCGGGVLGAGDRANYAAFMRYALRNSLRGEYTMENLGFRCAYDVSRSSR
jgi:sulfatase modifying factor 1